MSWDLILVILDRIFIAQEYLTHLGPKKSLEKGKHSQGSCWHIGKLWQSWSLTQLDISFKECNQQHWKIKVCKNKTWNHFIFVTISRKKTLRRERDWLQLSKKNSWLVLLCVSHIFQAIFVCLHIPKTRLKYKFSSVISNLVYQNNFRLS